MQDTHSSPEKRIVEQLNFGAKTARRVAWESFEFTVIARNEIRVTNASYGAIKEDHQYRVRVEERQGVATPVECSCPADTHQQDDCKHRVALATVGGPTVLETALEVADAGGPSRTPPRSESRPMPDGGTLTEGRETQEECPNGDPQCDGPEGQELPCFGCYEPTEAL